MDREKNNVHRYVTPVVTPLDIPRHAVDRDSFIEEAEVNLWVRANLHEYDSETFELVPDVLKPDYVRIMSDIALRGAALNDAQEAYRQSLSERHAFFSHLIGNEDGA
jgi:hypothetical protein